MVSRKARDPTTLQRCGHLKGQELSTTQPNHVTHRWLVLWVWYGCPSGDSGTFHHGSREVNAHINFAGLHRWWGDVVEHDGDVIIIIVVVGIV